MKSSLAKILRGRPAVAYGAGEYFRRFCDRTVYLFEYFVDDVLVGQNRNGILIRAVASLGFEQREMCVSVFCRDIGPALLALDGYGFCWGENVFDARVFGDGSQFGGEYRIPHSLEEVSRRLKLSYIKARGHAGP